MRLRLPAPTSKKIGSGTALKVAAPAPGSATLVLWVRVGVEAGAGPKKRLRLQPKRAAPATLYKMVQFQVGECRIRPPMQLSISIFRNRFPPGEFRLTSPRIMAFYEWEVFQIFSAMCNLSNSILCENYVLNNLSWTKNLRMHHWYVEG